MATTAAQLLTYCEQKTQAGTGTLNNATFGLNALNEAMITSRMEMIKRGVDASQLQESYVASVSAPATGNGSTFAYPSDMWALKTIEVNMTDTNPGNYITATQLDVANIPGQSSFSWLRLNQPISSPLFDDRGDTYEIFPSFSASANKTNAIRLFYFLAPTPYSSTSSDIAYPDALNIYILATKICAIYFESLNKFQEADIWNARHEKELEKLNTTLARGSQQPAQPSPIPLTGFEY